MDAEIGIGTDVERKDKDLCTVSTGMMSREKREASMGMGTGMVDRGEIDGSWGFGKAW
jgi:hypothetical protein